MLNNLLFLFGSFCLGTIFGSFLNVVVWRLPNNLGLGGRSFCPNCKHQLKALELVPILSYLGLKGKCKNCKQGISFRYPLIEVITGLLTVIVFIYFWPNNLLETLILIRNVVITYSLIAIFIIDFEYYLILDKVVFPVSLLVLIFNFVITILEANWHLNFNNFFLNSIVAGLGGSLLFGLVWLISQGKWLGFGDVKFMLLLGLMLGWPKIGVAVMLAFYLGALVAIPLLLFKKKELKSQIPFGTFLSIGAFITLLYGHSLITWYLNLMGL
jgi:leader peptidase (prepilin peptidase)/N-methyltransferase